MDFELMLDLLVDARSERQDSIADGDCVWNTPQQLQNEIIAINHIMELVRRERDQQEGTNA